MARPPTQLISSESVCVYDEPPVGAVSKFSRRKLIVPNGPAYPENVAAEVPTGRSNGAPLVLHRDRLKKLAASIHALSAKDDLQLQKATEIAALRRKAATQLYSVCSHFVQNLNTLLQKPEVRLDPEDYPEGSFLEDTINLLQINVRGRILQITFESTPELVSTEEFRVPYVLHGATRCFNQQLLDQELIEEHLLFYCLERVHPMWRFFDTRTYHTGAFDEEYLISLMERLV